MRRVLPLLLALLFAAVYAGPATAADSDAHAKKPKRCKTAKKKKKPAKTLGPTHAKKKPCKKPKKAKKPGKPGTPKPPATPPLQPLDYTTNPGLSTERYQETERITQRLRMDDGAEVYLEITKPKGATNLGVILEASPYHGTLYERTGTRILPLPKKSDGTSQGLTGYFPKRGYAVVMMDLRGTGRSDGCLDHLGRNDQLDLKTVIEWAATQPWSNGRVGMVGHSYVGSTPPIATKLDPKGLVTIVPSAGLAGIYDHQFQAGVPWFNQLNGPLLGYPPLATDADLPPGLPDPVTGATTGDYFGEGRPQDTGCQFANTTLNAGVNGYVLGQFVAWHAERDAVKEAKAYKGHVFLVHGVNDEAARIASMNWFNERGGKAGDKLWIGQWNHGIGCCPNRRGEQWTAALHAWFDRQLLQRDVNTGPPVEAFVNDRETRTAAITAQQHIATFTAWPPPQVKPSALTTGRELTRVGGEDSGSVAFVGDILGFQDIDQTGNATFATAPLAKDLLLVGVPKLALHASVVGPRPDLIALIHDEAPNGTRRRISRCAINPQLREGLDKIAPTVPGQRMALAPPCWSMAHRLPAGHRLVLRFQTSDPDAVPFGPVDLVTIFTGPGATTLTVPAIDGATLYPDTYKVGDLPPPS